MLQSAGYLPGFAQAPAAEPAATGDFASQSDVAALNQQVASLKQQLSSSAAPAASAGEGANAGSDGAAALKPVQDAANAAQATATGAQDAAGKAQQAADAAGQSATKANDAATGASQEAAKAQQSADGAQKTASDAGSAAASAQSAAEDAAKAARAAQEGVEATQASLGQMVDRVAAVEKGSQEARVALAAANLKSGIDSGAPFMSQLETYATVSGSNDTTNELRGYAADGVPSEQALAAAWPSTRDKIAASLTPSEPSAPVQDQFLSGLRSLVQVRPSGPAAASETGPQAVVSRLTAAVESGDLETFRTEWQTLPDPAKAASQDFADKVDARLAAQKAVSGALSSALSPSGSAAEPSDPAPAGDAGPPAADAPAANTPGNEAPPQAAPVPAAGTQG